ncbi:pyridoxamine 5'-phosphate oxidase [Pandoraea terrae]|uniref:Pyridoxamine 5'-phosphate oxidase n=1 Tax=Pandoraea terrae TaxID=1537710 RepID=A0A5E4V7F6_9BURK|nr:pyridoxamine 5'-phosphate oxidase family protein [Pandoraea terrae]VVE08031.1 pyridoxamine 5'-phosphate oxidase [Pandoraea terrae]
METGQSPSPEVALGLRGAARQIIDDARYLSLTTAGPDGDWHGDMRRTRPGAGAAVFDANTILIPEFDATAHRQTLRNLLVHPQISLWLATAAVRRGLHLAGKAQLSIQPELLGGLIDDGRVPALAIVVHVERITVCDAPAPAELPGAGGEAARFWRDALDLDRWGDSPPAGTGRETTDPGIG